MYSKTICLLLLTIFISACNTKVNAPIPDNQFSLHKSPPFLVNTSPCNHQSGPVLAMNKSGAFVINWLKQLPIYTDIASQRFLANTKATGGEFTINKTSPTENDNHGPDIAIDIDGGFITTWSKAEQNGQITTVYARRFNSQGQALGNKFQVNSYASDSSSSSEPSIAIANNGQFVIAWTIRDEFNGFTQAIYAKRFNADGQALGPEFAVSVYPTGWPGSPDIIMHTDASFTVTWTNYLQDGDSGGVFARQFTAQDIPVGASFQVNTTVTGSQNSPRIASDNAGNFTIVWSGDDVTTQHINIYGQRFNQNATPIGTEFTVNTHSAFFAKKLSPDIATSPDGTTVITWEHTNQKNNDYGIFARVYRKDGKAQGPEFLASLGEGYATMPSIGINQQNDFVITWMGGNNDIFARRFFYQ